MGNWIENWIVVLLAGLVFLCVMAVVMALLVCKDRRKEKSDSFHSR